MSLCSELYNLELPVPSRIGVQSTALLTILREHTVGTVCYWTTVPGTPLYSTYRTVRPTICTVLHNDGPTLCPSLETLCTNSAMHTVNDLETLYSTTVQESRQWNVQFKEPTVLYWTLETLHFCETFQLQSDSYFCIITNLQVPFRQHSMYTFL